MSYNPIPLNSKMHIWKLQLPMQANEVTNLVTQLQIASSKPSTWQNAILVDATQVDHANWNETIAMLLKLLRSVQQYASVTFIGLPYTIEQLIRFSAADDPKLSFHFAGIQQEAMSLISRLQTDSSAGAASYDVELSKFGNNQTKSLFEAFLENQNRLREWRNMIDTIHDSEAIESETTMFVKQYGLGDADDLTINWFRLITALLNVTDP